MQRGLARCCAGTHLVQTAQALPLHGLSGTIDNAVCHSAENSVGLSVHLLPGQGTIRQTDHTMLGLLLAAYSL